MKYDWLKLFKAESNIESQIIDLVSEHVLSHFGVEEVKELTEENITEVQAFWDTMGETIMGIGYSYIIAEWEES